MCDCFPSGKWRKIFLIMKLKIFFLLCCIGTLRAEVYSQVNQFSFQRTDVLVTEVLEELQSRSDYRFFYQKGIFGENDRVSIDLKNASLRQVLDEVLVKQGFGYEIIDKVITIRRNPQSQDKGMKINGRVTDNGKQPIPGVTVMIKGTALGSVTDAEGRYVLTIPQSEELVLVFSFVGMKRLEIPWKGEKELNVVLEEDVTEMDEVVVTGIFERPKESFTGSSATYTSKELKMVGNSNVIQSLKSLEPALIIADNDMFGSDPNKLPDMDIRGKTSIVGLQEEYEEDPNQPLFILDGFETSLRTIIDLNMDRVESVTVLKDAASTAIYGSKAANGVVVVETKKPVMGKLKLTYNGNLGISIPDLSVYNLMNASEKLEFERLAGRYVYGGADNNPEMQYYLNKLYTTRHAEVLRGVDSYWLSEPVRTGIDQKHRIYLDGGDSQMRYGIGVNYGNTQGVMKGSGREIVGGNVDLFYRKNKFQFNNVLSVDYTISEDVTVPFSEFAAANPYYRKRNENGEVEKILELSKDGTGKEYKVYNPLWNYIQDNRKESTSFSMTDNLGITWDILSSLKVRGRVGITLNRGADETFVSPMHTKYEGTDPLLRGSYQENNFRLFRYSGDVSVTYGKLLKEVHQINAVGGFNFSSTEQRNSSFSAVGFPEGFSSPSFASQFPEGSKPGYRHSVSRSASFFFNGGYAYDNRYLLDVNYRRDGSSVFGVRKRFTHTWSAGIAWNMHNEKFIDKEGLLNTLKLRFSVGNPGNQNFASTQAVTAYTFNNWMQNVFGIGNVVNKLGNPNLDWQQTWDYNAGIDLRMFKSRLSLTFDYYYRNTDPLIATIEQPASTGVVSLLTNFGNQINRGFTVNASYNLLRMTERQISWRVNLSMRRNKSFYENLGDELNKYNKENRSKSLSRYYDGASTTALWAVPSMGIDPMTGEEVFLTKEGTYTTTFSYDDEVEMGNTSPTVEGIVGTSFSFRGLNVSLRFRYKLGGDVFNSALYEKVENISMEALKKNQDKRALYDRWTTPGQLTSFKGISLTESTPMSGRFIQEENVLSGESVSVSYDFRGKWMKSAGISNLRLSGYVNDIFRLSTVKRERGISYPFARSVSFALSVTF